MRLRLLKPHGKGEKIQFYRIPISYHCRAILILGKKEKSIIVIPNSPRAFGMTLTKNGAFGSGYRQKIPSKITILQSPICIKTIQTKGSPIQMQIEDPRMQILEPDQTQKPVPIPIFRLYIIDS